MALCHFPSLFTRPHNFNNPHLKWRTHQFPLHRNLIFASSAEKSSRKKGKVSKPSKSNEDLCTELREFMSVAGFPENRLPTMKELSECGRKDLANSVRRRGYKVVRALLINSFKNLSDTEKSSIEEPNFKNACSEEASEVKGRDLVESAEYFSSTSGSSMMETYMVRTNDAAASDISVQVCSSSESFIACLHSRAANFVETGKLDVFEAYVGSQEVPSLPQQIYRDRLITEQGLEGAGNAEKFTSEMDSERINRAEIDHLKAMLRQKEVELLELKRHIEMEKQALYTLQDKANKGIFNAHRMATEKDMELHVAEESLSGLKEVLIEYWGNGEIVEVAGSFNGWHNRIKMDLHTLSEQLEPLSRGLKLWSTILWLYPGIYEIKFIVDGTWKVDPNREMSTSCNITNNILRVDR
ncbi:protein PTST, chloroplastic-like isoform X3 [Asparagus officinalis]|uniref:protein PTST, chloroplastic-like isoform X3 n=1 Tax=Asparagus officinalis TaxID=4686 RepID=UPI00098DFA2D|nr:protein PTST, chloroplastic-like isoform X3 [Asparagus officinalis]